MGTNGQCERTHIGKDMEKNAQGRGLTDSNKRTHNLIEQMIK